MTGTDDTYRCTLSSTEASSRLDADQALADRVVNTERSENGVRLAFDARRDTRELVDTFVANESRCCGFFDFAVTETEGEITLEITAPAAPAAQELVDAAKEAFDLSPDGIAPATVREVGDG